MEARANFSGLGGLGGLAARRGNLDQDSLQMAAARKKSVRLSSASKATFTDVKVRWSSVSGRNLNEFCLHRS